MYSDMIVYFCRRDHKLISIFYYKEGFMNVESGMGIGKDVGVTYNVGAQSVPFGQIFLPPKTAV